jgi:hypothetical protein
VEVPAPYKTAGICNLASGALGVLYNFGFFISTIWFCVGLYFLIPLAAHGYQAWIGYQMFNGEPSPAAKNAAIAGAVGGLFSFNIIALGLSAFAFMQIGNDEVKGWLEQHGAA